MTSPGAGKDSLRPETLVENAGLKTTNRHYPACVLERSMRLHLSVEHGTTAPLMLGQSVC